MAKKKNPVNTLNEVDFSEFEQENVDFPGLCKFIRNTLNVTQQQMAEKLDITLRAYTFWEEGRRAPRGWQAMKLCLLYLYAKETFLKKGSSEEHITTNPSSQNQNNQDQAA